MVHGQVLVGTALVLGAAMAFGLNPLFARLLFADGVGAEMATLYRFALPALVLLPFVRCPRPEWPEAARMLALGVINGVAMLCFFRAIQVVPVSTAILIYYTYPVFSVLVGWLAFARAPTRESLIAAALILVAAALVIDPRGLPGDAVLPLAACFLAPLVFAVVVQYLAAPHRPMPPVRRMAVCMQGHVLILVPLAALEPSTAALPTSWTGVAAVLGIGLIGAALPQYLFTVGAPKAGPERTTVAGGAELIVAMLTGAVLLGENLGRLEVAAMALVLIALALRQDTGRAVERLVPAPQRSG